ncbi:hypothetical protein MRX96_017960 [Rhipicephalus microplus]
MPGVETSEPMSTKRSATTSRHSAIHPNASVKEALKSASSSSEDLKMIGIFKANLSRYPVVTSDKVRRVIIVTYFQAGSNFVADLLSSSPPTFYHYEPLRIYGVATRLNEMTACKAISLIGHLLRYKLQSEEQYVHMVFEKKDLFKRNRFLWTLCQGNSGVCFWPDFVSKVCARAPVQVMKITCLHMSQVRDWLRSNPDLATSVKILHLVQDPRGILASRRLLGWCNGSKRCVHPATLCSELRTNLNTNRRARQDVSKQHVQGPIRGRVSGPQETSAGTIRGLLD